MFAKKVVLTKRIRWFEDSTGSPSFNHCWMIWDRQHQRAEALMPVASRNTRAQAWLPVGLPTSSTRVLVRMPRADSAEATGALPPVGGWGGAADS